MTNIEKFAEVFGYVPSLKLYFAPEEFKDCKKYDPTCEGCPYEDWIRQEYKEDKNVSQSILPCDNLQIQQG